MAKEYKGKYDKDRQSREYGGDSIIPKAQQYIPALRPILSFEDASTEAIKTGISAIEELVKNNKGITTHQVRNIFDLITEVGRNDLSSLNMLRPKLAYIGARQDKMDGKIIVKVLDLLIQEIDTSETADKIGQKINGLQRIMESIVAYHKFHGNKNQ